MTRMIMIIAVFFMLSMFLLSNVAANFVCGEVKTNAEESPAWTNVIIFYSDQPNFTSQCKVSPKNNRFCCDPLTINKPWAIGKKIKAKIQDSSNGLFSDNFELVISGEGYDVFPVIEANKALKIHEPNKSIFFNQNDIEINVSLGNGFDNLYYVLTNEQSQIIREEVSCNRCNQSFFTLNSLNPGSYKLTFFTNGTYGLYNESISFTVVNNIEISRNIECDGCNENFISSSTSSVNVSVTLSSSQNIHGTLFDIFPAEWDFIEEEGNVEIYNSTHNVIKWDVEGKEIVKSYVLIPPKNIIPRKYSFQSGINERKYESNIFLLYRFWTMLFNQGIFHR